MYFVVKRVQLSGFMDKQEKRAGEDILWHQLKLKLMELEQAELCATKSQRERYTHITHMRTHILRGVSGRQTHRRATQMQWWLSAWLTCLYAAPSKHSMA